MHLGGGVWLVLSGGSLLRLNAASRPLDLPGKISIMSTMTFLLMLTVFSDCL